MSFARKRLVFDTSVLVSAAIKPSSMPHKALEKAFSSYTLVASQDTLQELVQVLARDYLDKYMPKALRQEFVHGYQAMVQMTQVTPHPTPCRDPKDEKFLWLATSAKASFIVSSDDDLLSLHPYQGIDIIKAADFLLRPSQLSQ